MILSIVDFQDATAFELFTLTELCPVLEQPQGASIDLRGGKTIAAVKITISENMSQGAIDATLNKLVPLLFGAAWKILDLAIEFALNCSGAEPKKDVWAIAEKAREADAWTAGSSVLGCSTPVWQALMRLYSATVEHRHCLIHRTATVDPETGALSGVDRNRTKLPLLSREQLFAFSKAMGLVGRGIIAPPIQSRSEDHLKFFLDKLSPHTRATPFGVHGPDAPASLEIDAECSGNVVQLNIDAALARARSVFTSVSHFDVVAYLADGRQLLCRAEDLPQGTSAFDLNALPLWMKLVLKD